MCATQRQFVQRHFSGKAYDGFMNSGPRLVWVFPVFRVDPPWWPKFDSGSPYKFDSYIKTKHMFQKNPENAQASNRCKTTRLPCPSWRANFKKHQLVKSVSRNKRSCNRLKQKTGFREFSNIFGKLLRIRTAAYQSILFPSPSIFTSFCGYIQFW